jgi:cephalosporin hydroxylase
MKTSILDLLTSAPIFRRMIISGFHRIFYNSYETWPSTHWLGVSALKCPFDLWVYQEIIFDTRPDIIIECGTASGGSALYLASICDMVNNGIVITIDIKNEHSVNHKRIKYLTGSSVSLQILSEVQKLINLDRDKIMVILDSDHHKKHVLEELQIYSKFVTKGHYLIVEDSNLNGHPVCKEFGEGPFEAINIFLKENQNFNIDKTKEKYSLTFNPNGYLQKI